MNKCSTLTLSGLFLAKPVGRTRVMGPIQLNVQVAACTAMLYGTTRTYTDMLSVFAVAG